MRALVRPAALKRLSDLTKFEIALKRHRDSNRKDDALVCAIPVPLKEGSHRRAAIVSANDALEQRTLCP